MMAQHPSMNLGGIQASAHGPRLTQMRDQVETKETSSSDAGVDLWAADIELGLATIGMKCLTTMQTAWLIKTRMHQEEHPGGP